MLTHTDYDSTSVITESINIPEVVTSISISHDGGRISIYINDFEVYCTLSGTRDCCIEITKDKSKGEEDV